MKCLGFFYFFFWNPPPPIYDSARAAFAAFVCRHVPVLLCSVLGCIYALQIVLSLLSGRVCVCVCVCVFFFLFDP
jgi:hypothetical protein